MSISAPKDIPRQVGDALEAGLSRDPEKSAVVEVGIGTSPIDSWIPRSTMRRRRCTPSAFVRVTRSQ